MFNNKYRLNDAALDGTKTNTRRLIPLTGGDREYLDSALDWDFRESVIIDRYARYKVGEEVAIAQCYKDMANEGGDILANMLQDETTFKKEYCGAGWHNKMFVRAELMPHSIKITNIRIERLQDITDEDCLKEGIKTFKNKNGDDVYSINNGSCFTTPRLAFASLIDKVSGKGTWDSNPYVLVYEFQLIK